MPSTSAAFEPPIFSAKYYDGKTAQRHDVTVCLRAAALDVVADDGSTIDQWPYDSVELSDQGSAGSRVVRRGTEARLVIPDSSAFAQLKALSPNLVSQRQRTLRNVGLSVAVMVGVILTGYLSLPLLSSVIVNMVPLETEARLGDSYADEVATLFAAKKSGALCYGNSGRQTLNRITYRLSRFTSGPFDYRVDVLDTPLVNAMALPGGRIFLFRGLLDKAESLDEVAGVLAHEMEHVNMRHGMQALVRSFGANALADLMFGGNVMGNFSRFLMMTSYSRDAESAADEGAIATLRQAGIGTAGMARFFARLKDNEDEGVFALPGLLSTHPPSAARESLAHDAEQQQPTAWNLSVADLAALKSICE